MKLKLLNIIIVAVLSACSSINIAYNPKEFDTVNYQKNVENAVDATDILKDFDNSRIPQANLEPADFSSLVQADIYFNQGDYVKAYEYYKLIAFKYKDPRIIYKAIVCLEHFSSTKEQTTQLDKMLALFIKINPDSQIAKLFQIKVALNQNKFSMAKDDLNDLMNKNPQKGRIILLFISSLLTGGLNKANSDTLTEFGDYVANNYKAYPEANLVSAINYASANNTKSLANRLDLIQKKFPNWDIPAVWTISLILHNGNESAAIFLLESNLKNNKDPNIILQNMYVGTLIRTKQFSKARAYSDLSIQNNLGKDNALINLGLIQALQNDYNGALNSFVAANPIDKSQAGIIKSAIGSIYDYQGKHLLAIKYYEEVSNLNQSLATPARILILNDYAALGDKVKTNKILSELAASNKLNAKETILFKAGFYLDTALYIDAYKILAENYKKYTSDKDYLYAYAGAAAMARNTKLAIKLYTKCIKLDPQNAMVYNDLAFVYADGTNDYKKGYSYAIKAFKLNPNDSNILDTLGWVYYKLGDYSKALKYIKASIDKHYDIESAKHLRDTYFALNQHNLAAKVIIITKDQIQANLKRQLLNKTISVLLYMQFGIEIKKNSTFGI
ncbi:MAG: hypothetical protein K0R49_1313 [Burkholderiales bacterium]|jgi:tetratricopeptide (TPR) repeat protein|nr:hypothetical protein [Burkholderiales bacterium]